MGSEGRQQQVPELRAWLSSGVRSRAPARGGLAGPAGEQGEAPQGLSPSLRCQAWWLLLRYLR